MQKALGLDIVINVDSYTHMSFGRSSSKGSISVRNVIEVNESGVTLASRGGNDGGRGVTMIGILLII